VIAWVDEEELLIVTSEKKSRKGKKTKKRKLKILSSDLQFSKAKNQTRKEKKTTSEERKKIEFCHRLIGIIFSAQHTPRGTSLDVTLERSNKTTKKKIKISLYITLES
jgi:hypothetical protein